MKERKLSIKNSLKIRDRIKTMKQIKQHTIMKKKKNVNFRSFATSHLADWLFFALPDGD